MKHIFKYFACLFVALLCFGQVWATDYQLVTSTSDLEAGVNYVIGSAASGSGVFMATTTNTNNRKQTDAITITDGKITATASVLVLQLGGSTGAWTFLTTNYEGTDGYLANADSGTGNNCKVGSTERPFTISFDGEKAVITATAGNAKNIIRYNSGSSCFACYASGQKDVYLYKEVTSGGSACATPTFSPVAGSYEGAQNVTISSTKGATIYYTTDGSTPSTSSSVYSDPIEVSADMTIKAYAVKANIDDSDVATAAYSITKGPDVTLNLIDGKWGFPTSGGTTLTEYTNSETGYAVSCYAANEYKVSGSSYFFIGQSGSYIKLPVFESSVEKIVIVGNSTGSGSVVFNIYDGDDAASTAVTGCTSDKTFEIENPAANKQYTLKVTSKHNLQLKAIKIYFGAAPTVTKPTIDGEEYFVTSTTVTLDCTTDGADIFYTTNGSDPKSGAKYTEPFTLSADATVKAIAKKGDDWSTAVSKSFTKVTAMTTMAEVLAAATTEETPINVVVTNWVVTAVSSSQVWMADSDNERGILLYKSGHGFETGKKLNGTVLGTKLKLYNNYPELTTLTASDVTVTTADPVVPQTKTIPNLIAGFPYGQGTVVKLENIPYSSSSAGFSDGTYTIAVDTRFISSVALVDAASYNVTGVVMYAQNNVIKIMPRSADDVEKLDDTQLTEVDGLAELKEQTIGSYAVNLTNAVVTFVDGNNAFIEDATASALIYFSGHGLAAGDKLNGLYEVTTATYNGKFEITAMTAQTGAETTHNAEIPVTTLTIAQLNANFAANESRRIKIVGVNVTDAIGNSDRNGEISDGANTIILYAGKSGVSATLNDNIDAIGYPTFYVTNNADQRQFAVWAQSDITVNVKEAAGIAFTPTSATITGGDAWTAPEFANPNSLTVTFSSDDETVAKVSNAGVVTLEGGYGTAVITAHTDGDATHNAGNATYTITVNDPASVDTRKVAESPEGGFSSISGNLSGNEISFAAYQGGAQNAPNGNNTAHELRLYKYQATTEYGGYITVSAKSGCTIDQVVITVGGNCNVGYCKEVEDLPTKESTPIAVSTSNPFDTGTGLDADSVRVVNLDGSNQFKIKTITVYYTGEAVTLQSIAISGTASVKEYNDGDEFDPAGLVVTGHYSDNSDAEITDGITWAFDPATLSEGTSSVSITATVSEITSPAFVVNGLTVSEAVTPPTPANVCDGTDDIATDKTSDGGSYKERETTNGWTAVNTARKTIEEDSYWTINGKTTAVGVITSPELSDGIATLKFRYANTNQESNGVSVKIVIKQNGEVKKEHTLTKSNSEVVQNTVYTESIENINIEGTFQIVITNLSPSNNNSSNKDRVSIGCFCWTNYSATPASAYTEVRNELTAGWYYTMCLDKAVTAVQGASIWRVISKSDNSEHPGIILEEVTGTLDAGRPYFFYATADKLKVIYTGSAVGAPLTEGNNGLVGSFEKTKLAQSDDHYILYDNELYYVNSNNVYVGANRAYLDMTGVPAYNDQSGSAPGRRRVTMNVHGKEVATGVDAVNASGKPMKVMIDGQLFILRGEKMYDATGRLVK